VCEDLAQKVVQDQAPQQIRLWQKYLALIPAKQKIQCCPLTHCLWQANRSQGILRARECLSLEKNRAQKIPCGRPHVTRKIRHGGAQATRRIRCGRL
jgi:hypothetical protein